MYNKRMADKDSAPRSPIKDFGWLALFLIVLGVIWFAQGGPSRLATMTSGPFVKVPMVSVPGSSSEEGGGTSGGSATSGVQLIYQDSPYKGEVFLNASDPRETDSQKEYLEIRTGYNIGGPIQISGWTLKGKEGLAVSIPNGTYLPYSAQVNPQEPINLKSNEKAVIITGRSPIGTNFRLNICTGYFSQFQTFYPYLPQECPLLSEEDVPINYPGACFDFVEGLTTCRMPVSSPPPQAGNDCAMLISEKVNYNSCVADYKNDANFYKPEWRVYLGRDKELWANDRDSIVLLDREGKLIDQVSY
jgi:hypothetical protein